MRRRLQKEPTRVPHLVNIRILSRENAGVGRRRKRRLRDSVFKQHAPLRDTVHGGGLNVRVPVAAQMIWTQSVNGYHYDIEGPETRDFIGPISSCLRSRIATGKRYGDQEQRPATSRGRTHLLFNLAWK